jgi:ferrochelatase
VSEEETCNSLAVVVFQLGGPDSLEAVEPFLFNLFSDPDIIDFPFARLARPTMARLISSRRARHVREHYAAIGGQSPIRQLTERQAGALERELRKSVNARVFVAMRYWHPLTEEAVEQVSRGNFRRLVLLPLYPQYSKTTSGSSLNEWQRQWPAKSRNHIPTRIIPDFHDHAGYLDAVVQNINEGLAGFRPASISAVAPVYDRRFSARRSQSGAAEDVLLVFSAHGLPLSVIAAGDPYQQQIEATVRGVMARGGWPNPHALCYQSRVSPGKWLEPTLEGTLRKLAARGAKGVLVIPISFVTDHVETLSEINIEARRLAENLGIEQFELMPALNDSPTFIRALVDLVLRELAGEA